ncbi:MAG: ATP-binding protein [Candidatus Paceibacterota bacterium]|jgi:signal transduction histidine kinase
MDANINLIIHNILSIVSVIAGIGLASFFFFNNFRSKTTILLALTMLCAAIFSLSHVIGVNIADPNISKIALMFNLVNFFIITFNYHGITTFLNIEYKSRYSISLVYAFSISMLVFFIIFPETFLLPSIPKMYFPNYYDPGVLNFVRMLFMYVLIFPYCMYLLIVAYFKAKKEDTLWRNKIKYFILAMFFGYVPGNTANFLVYNIHIDPVWGMAFLGLSVPFLIYGAVKYGLCDIKVIAKQAFFYGVAIALVGGVIALFDYFNRLAQVYYQNFPIWVSPIIISIIVVSIAIVVWRRLREQDLLKYEFITTVTHKFRTPLTHIKWAAENLNKTVSNVEDRTQIDYIREANSKLVGLTDLLINVSETDNASYEYHKTNINLNPLIEDIVDSLKDQIGAKKLQIEKNFDQNVNTVCDESRIKFVIQVFLENAIHYSKENGTIVISLKNTINGTIVYSVKDSGIGVPKEEIPLLFSKFYRGNRARSQYTEGMGIGLYMSKDIIERHKGKIWAESDGSGMGSTFSFSF